MNALYAFTRRSLLLNKVRTLVTIIGIALSMALFTAVIEGAYSGIDFMKRSEIAEDGSWHAILRDVSSEDYETLLTDSDVKKLVSMRELGWALGGSGNMYKPYLDIFSISDDFTDMVPLHLRSGRLPENDKEILLSDHLKYNGGVEYAVGDEITLEIGKRMTGGEEITTRYDMEEASETIEVMETRTFTVVGICERVDISIEPYSCPGYFAFTKGDAGRDFSAFVELVNPREVESFIHEKSYSEDPEMHRDLLCYYGVTGTSNLIILLYGFAAILVFLIAFGSISLIYNAFAISVSERMRLFGILKSLGATKRQIRLSVIYEAGLLSLIGIPVGLLCGLCGIGITLWCLRDYFSAILGGRSVPMRLALAPIPILLAALICFITILISAMIPARRAIKASPMEAIRQSADIKVKEKEVKTSKFLTKHLGFEGLMALKNFKRNKKRYRSVVFSLFVSIVLFISASSFCSYLTRSVSTAVEEGKMADIAYDLYYNEYMGSEGEDLSDRKEEREAVSKVLLEASGIDEAYIYEYGRTEFLFDKGILDNSYLSIPMEDQIRDGEGYVDCFICFLNDDAFERLLKKQGISKDSYFDRNAPMALYQPFGQAYYYDEKKDQDKREGYRAVKESAFPFDGHLKELRLMIGDYEFYSMEENDQIMYLKKDFLDQVRMREKDIADAKEEDQMVINREKAYTYIDIHVGAELKGNIPGFGNYSYIVYPISMKESVLGDMEGATIGKACFNFMSKAYQKTYEEMSDKLMDAGYPVENLNNYAQSRDTERMIITVVYVFSYGFITLISLIAMANVFNTISTNVSLRKREYAMLRSIGMGNKALHKMMRLECLIYGLKGILWGLPASILVTYGIWMMVRANYYMTFYIPWYSVVISVGSVFFVVFITMRYAVGKVSKENTIDALKNENQ